MNYIRVYWSIIHNRLHNKVDGYIEHHHIIPRSEGGNDNNDNIVALTAREHYICHLLLAKIYNDYKMLYAWNMMLCKNSKQRRDFKFNSRLYEKLKIKYSRHNSEFQKLRFSDQKNKEYLKKPKSELHKQHLRESFKNRDFNGEKNPMYRKNIKDFMTDESYEKWRHNVGNSRRGKIGIFKLSDKSKEKISKSNSGRIHSETSRRNMAKSHKHSRYRKLINTYGFEIAKIKVCEHNSYNGWMRSIHKGYENLRVSKLALCDYLIDGWEFGHCSRYSIEAMKKTRINQIVSDETREKISKAKKGKKNLKLTGRHLSDETKKKLSDARKKMKGILHHSKETIEKIRLSKLGKHIEVIDGKRKLVD